MTTTATESPTTHADAPAGVAAPAGRTAASTVPLHPLLAERWSPRAYRPGHPLTTDEATALLEAARWAPSRSNGQPGRYVLAQHGEPAFAAVTGALKPTNALWASRASALVVALAPTDGDPLHRGFDLGLAVGHLVVQATALGLHARQMAGFFPDALHTALDLPADLVPVVVVAVGHRDDPAALDTDLHAREHAPRSRLPLEDVVVQVRPR